MKPYYFRLDLSRRVRYIGGSWTGQYLQFSFPFGKNTPHTRDDALALAMAKLEEYEYSSAVIFRMTPSGSSGKSVFSHEPDTLFDTQWEKTQ